jgi:hypothetical protein
MYNHRGSLDRSGFHASPSTCTEHTRIRILCIDFPPLKLQPLEANIAGVGLIEEAIVSRWLRTSIAGNLEVRR